MTRQYVTNRKLGMTVLILLCLAGAVGVMFPPHVYPIAVVLAGLVLALMIYSPISALMIYLVFFLAWPQEWAPYFNYLPAITERIVAFMAIGSMAITMLVRQRTGFYVGIVGYGFIALFVSFVLSAFTAFYLTAAKDQLIDVLRLFTVFVLIANVCDTAKKLKAVAWLYFASVGIMSTISVINYYNGITQYTMGITRALGLGGSYGDPNSHGSTIAYALPVMFYHLKATTNRLERYILIGFGLIGCWNIILTGSRTAMVGVLFVVGIVVWRSKNKIAYALIGLVLLIFAYVVMPEQYKERFASTTDLSSETAASESARGRIEGLVDGFKLFMMSPLTGIGVGCYSDARHQEFGTYLAAHNLLGELIAEAGFLGLVAFSFFVWAIFRSIKDARTYLRSRQASSDARFLYGLTEGLYISFLMLFLLGMAAHNLYRYNWYFFAALVAVTVRVMYFPDPDASEAEVAESERRLLEEEDAS